MADWWSPAISAAAGLAGVVAGAWLTRWRDREEHRYTFLRRQLEDFRESQVEQLEEYRAIEREIARKPQSRYGYLTLRYGLALMPCRLEWIDQALKELSR